jgi:hypothetical protein
MLVWADGWNEVQNVHKGKDLKPYTETNCRKWPCENRSSWWVEMADCVVIPKEYFQTQPLFNKLYADCTFPTKKIQGVETLCWRANYRHHSTWLNKFVQFTVQNEQKTRSKFVSGLLSLAKCWAQVSTTPLDVVLELELVIKDFINLWTMTNFWSITEICMVFENLLLCSN